MGSPSQQADRIQGIYPPCSAYNQCPTRIGTLSMCGGGEGHGELEGSDLGTQRSQIVTATDILQLASRPLFNKRRQFAVDKLTAEQ